MGHRITLEQMTLLDDILNAVDLELDTDGLGYASFRSASAKIRALQYQDDEEAQTQYRKALEILKSDPEVLLKIKAHLKKQTKNAEARILLNVFNEEVVTTKKTKLSTSHVFPNSSSHAKAGDPSPEKLKTQYKAILQDYCLRQLSKKTLTPVQRTGIYSVLKVLYEAETKLSDITKLMFESRILEPLIQTLVTHHSHYEVEMAVQLNAAHHQLLKSVVKKIPQPRPNLRTVPAPVIHQPAPRPVAQQTENQGFFTRLKSGFKNVCHHIKNWMDRDPYYSWTITKFVVFPLAFADAIFGSGGTAAIPLVLGYASAKAGAYVAAHSAVNLAATTAVVAAAPAVYNATNHLLDSKTTSTSTISTSLGVEIESQTPVLPPKGPSAVVYSQKADLSSKTASNNPSESNNAPSVSARRIH